MSLPSQSVRTCYRHPDSPAGVVCQRCDRPICPKCMHQASVGFHCPECVKKEHTRVVRAKGLRTTQPLLTNILIAINVIVWVGGQLLWRPSDLLNTSNTAIRVGSLVASAVQVSPTGAVGPYLGVAHGQWYRLLTAGFIHAGLFHIAMNMWALYVLGKVTEQVLGRLRMGLVYFVSLFAGSFGALITSPHSITVGASGAIFGLMGGLLAVAKARGIAMRDTGLIGVLAINLVITFGLSSYISVGAHIGGLIGGFIAGLAIVDLPNRMQLRDQRSHTIVTCVIGVGLCVVFIVAGILAANHAAAGLPDSIAASVPQMIRTGLR